MSAESAFRLVDLSEEVGSGFFELRFDTPGEKVNKLSEKVMEEFELLLAELETKGKAGKIECLILSSGKPTNFIAGADIEMIRAAENAEDARKLSQKGQDLYNRWEDLPFPRVCAVNGSCMGGGLELCMASTATVASDGASTKLAVPEVMLGIIPGIGGCVRLPRKIGIAGALDMILTGKGYDGKKAKKIGLVEECLPDEDFVASVHAWAKKNLASLKAGKRLAREPRLGGAGGIVGKILEGTPMGRSVIYKKAEDTVRSKTGGHYPAPLEAIKVLKSNGVTYRQSLSFSKREACMRREAEAFGKVAATDVSRNLIRLFFLTEKVKKSNGVNHGSRPSNKAIHTGAVLGAGVMGGGIAQLLSAKDITVRMKDLNEKALEMGMESALKVFKKKLQRRRMTKREMLQKINRITPTTSYRGFRSVDTVIEAIIEKMEIKKSVLKELENEVSDQCIIASNTSSLSITEMQNELKHPERFAGLHFFNPVHRMPLIEVIRGEKTSDDTVSSLFEFSKSLGKTPIVVKDGPGFLVNRLLLPYMNEAGYLVRDGAPIEEVDKAFLKFGMPMGPLELVDEVGVDVGDKVLHILHDAFGERMKPFGLTENVIKADRLGKKNGKGIYDYTSKKKKKTLDKKIYEILEVSPSPGQFSYDEMVERCIYPMINEAARCLEENIVQDPSDVDLGMIMGTGFPPFRGGLLRYADSVGLDRIVQRLEHYQSKFGLRFEPAALLVSKAEKKENFY